MPSQEIGGIFPVIQIDQFATLSRGSAPNRNRNYTIQPNVSLTRGAHNIRSGLDMRWTNVFNENYNNGRQPPFNRDFTRSTLNSTNALEGNAFASFLLGAPTTATWTSTRSRTTSGSSRRPGSRTTGASATTDGEPRLPLGRQRVRDGREQHAELRVRPDDRQPGVGARRSAGHGGIRFAGVDGAPNRPWKLDKNNYQAASARRTRSTRRPCSAPATEALPQPDESRQQRRVQSGHRRDRVD